MTMAEITAAVASEIKAKPKSEPKLVPVNDAVYTEVLRFLNHEAALLDDDRHLEWLDLLAEDISYRMPVRKNVYRKDGRGFDDANSHFNDDQMSLGLRVKRSVEIQFAYDRDPAPRIRRVISNVLVFQGDKPDEYRTTSYILLLRNRFDQPSYDILTAKREDVVRRTPEGLRLCRRLILVDQATLGAPYLNVFM